MRWLAVSIALGCTLLLGGCYHQPIEQGNVLTSSKVNQLHNGMSVASVKSIMGVPLMQNMYQNNRLVYVYTQQPTTSHVQTKRVIVTFSDGKAIRIQKHMD